MNLIRLSNGRINIKATAVANGCTSRAADLALMQHPDHPTNFLIRTYTAKQEKRQASQVENNYQHACPMCLTVISAVQP